MIANYEQFVTFSRDMAIINYINMILFISGMRLLVLSRRSVPMFIDSRLVIMLELEHMLTHAENASIAMTAPKIIV